MLPIIMRPALKWTLLLAIAAPAPALPIRDAFNLVGLSFTGPSIVETLQIMGEIPVGVVFQLSGTYDSDGFQSQVVNLTGSQALILNLAGTLTGTPNDDHALAVTIFGSSLNGRPITGSATLTFPFDAALDDYGDAEYFEEFEINPGGKKNGKLKPKGGGWLGWAALIVLTVVDYVMDSGSSTVEVTLPNGKKVKKATGSTYEFTDKQGCKHVFKDPQVSTSCSFTETTFTSTFQTVPEPSTLAMLGIATGLLATRRWGGTRSS